MKRHKIFAAVIVAVTAGALMLGVALAAAGDITTVAGTGVEGFNGDGIVATSGQLRFPSRVAVDSSGNLFIADQINHRIRRVDASSGIITTVAGNGNRGDGGDGGPATSAKLFGPTGVAVDASGNLFIADRINSRIRLVDGVTGIITTVAGSGTIGDCGSDGDGGPATAAELCHPSGVVVDASGILFIADTGTHRVRKVDASGIITTVAGNGIQGDGGDGGPATSAKLFGPTGVAVDAWGNLFIADRINSRIRLVDGVTGMITTVAGSGTTGDCGFDGDGGPATAAELCNPSGVVVDASGNFFIADRANSRIRLVEGVTGIITTVAGNGNQGDGGDGGPDTSISLNRPFGVALDALGNLFIADTDNHRIRRVEDVFNAGPPSDSTASIIILVGSITVIVVEGSTYIDAGATAEDNVDGDITSDIVTVGLPIDTSVVDTHVITYDVEDAAGNDAAQVTRTVVVESSESAVSRLVGTMEALGLSPKGLENSLISKLNAVLKSLEKGNDTAAVNQLNAFISEVQAQSDKKIGLLDADALIASAQAIIDSI